MNRLGAAFRLVLYLPALWVALGVTVVVLAANSDALVDIVLYAREVLQEGGEDCTGYDYDVISINGRPTKDEMPIAPMTLIANHFELDGGTATGMTPEEFETALRESVLFWKNKAMLSGKNK